MASRVSSSSMMLHRPFSSALVVRTAGSSLCRHASANHWDTSVRRAGMGRDGWLRSVVRHGSAHGLPNRAGSRPPPPYFVAGCGRLGLSLEDRRDLLGHKGPDITTHYSAAEIGRLIEAANRITGDSNPRPRHYELAAQLKITFKFNNVSAGHPLRLSRRSTTEHNRFSE